MAQEAKFCAQCGQSIPVPNPPFCSKCGASLASPTDTPSNETPIPSEPPIVETPTESERVCIHCQEVITDSDISDRSNFYGLKCGHCGEWNNPKRNNVGPAQIGNAKNDRRLFSNLTSSDRKKLLFAVVGAVALIWIIGGLICNSGSDQYSDMPEQLNPYLVPWTDNYQGSEHIENSLRLAGNDQHGLAIEEIDKALVLDPDSSGAIFFHGTLYEERNQEKEALSHYEKAIKLNPDEIWFRETAADYYMHLASKCRNYNSGGGVCDDRIQGARRHLTKLIELTPDNAALYKSRSWVTAYLPYFPEQKGMVADDKEKACYLDNKYCR